MPLTAAAEQELRDALRAFRAAHGGAVVPAAAGKALECWVLLKVADAVSTIGGWQVTLRQGDGNLLPPGALFKLPSRQSGIAAGAPGAPGYVLLEPPQPALPRLELHASLQWRGRSDATHECDVSILPAMIGEALRRANGGRPCGLPIVAIECKDKITKGTLDETRQTLARMYDLALVTRPAAGVSCRIYGPVTWINWGNWSSRYVTFFSKGTFAIVRAGGFQQGTEALASHYHIQRYPNIYNLPQSMTDLLDHVRATVQASGNF